MSTQAFAGPSVTFERLSTHEMHYHGDSLLEVTRCIVRVLSALVQQRTFVEVCGLTHTGQLGLPDP